MVIEPEPTPTWTLKKLAHDIALQVALRLYFYTRGKARNTYRKWMQ